jgi:ribose transport system permease protein
MPQGLNKKLLSAVQRVTKAREFGIFLFLLGIYLFLFILKPPFREVGQQLMVVRQFAWIAIVAVGMTMVIITAGIDLSVGSILALSACSMGKFVEVGVNIWVAVGLGLIVGAACGTLNGLTVTKLKIPPFIATLGMMGMARGATYIVTKRWYKPLPENFVRFLGEGHFLGVPVPVWIMAVVAVGGSVFLRHTTTGRYIYAIGGNEEAARLSGIKVDRVKLIVYTVTGFLAGVAGMLMAARTYAAQPEFGKGDELRVIAAVIVGGTNLMGGEGSVLGTIIGAAVLGIIPCGLILFRFPADWEFVALGAIIVVAVGVEQLKKR